MAVAPNCLPAVVSPIRQEVCRRTVALSRQLFASSAMRTASTISRISGERCVPYYGSRSLSTAALRPVAPGCSLATCSLFSLISRPQVHGLEKQNQKLLKQGVERGKQVQLPFGPVTLQCHCLQRPSLDARLTSSTCVCVRGVCVCVCVCVWCGVCFKVDALDDLLQRERSALQEVLQACRKRVPYPSLPHS